MRVQVRGIRSIEIEMVDPERAAMFYSQVWHLSEIDRRDGSIYLRATGCYHHVLAIHRAAGVPALRRIVYDAASRDIVDRLFQSVRAQAPQCEAPHVLSSPGGGYGFGFTDPDRCNFAVVCDVRDHEDCAGRSDHPTKISHVNLNSPDISRAGSFLVDALGFTPMDHSGALTFFRGDSADHSSMVLCQAPWTTLNHVAFEMPDVDSTMRGAGRMRDHGYPIEWGVGRHGPSGNVFAYFAGPEELPIEYSSEIRQVDDSYVPRGPEFWSRPPGRTDEWGITNPHTARWKRIQELFRYVPDAYRL
jgi:catechol 2,3-dioxygenase